MFVKILNHFSSHLRQKWPSLLKIEVNCEQVLTEIHKMRISNDHFMLVCRRDRMNRNYNT